jgi:hypothetical protein
MNVQRFAPLELILTPDTLHLTSYATSANGKKRDTPSSKSPSAAKLRPHRLRSPALDAAP